MHSVEKKALDKVVKKIISDPSIGEVKKGDLAGVQVYKYKLKAQQFLIAYKYVAGELLLTFIEQGTHENFYQNLKRQ